MANFTSPAFASYEIQSPRVIIRKATATDAQAFHQYLSNQANFPDKKVNPLLTIDHVRTRIFDFAVAALLGKATWLIFVLRETGELIGYGGYNTFEEVTDEDQEDSSCGKELLTDLGIMIDHRFWRKGYGTEILSALADYAYDTLGCKFVRVETSLDNKSMRSMMTSLGMGAIEIQDATAYDGLEGAIWIFTSEQWQKRCCP